jgi:hypothetical protein
VQAGIPPEFSVAKADDQTLNINGLSTSTLLQNALQNAINATGGSGIVTVTGTVSGITKDVTLNLPTGVTLKWQASITGDLGSMNYTGKALLKITGGIIEVADGGNIEMTGSGNSALITSGDVIVSGGTVSCINSTIGKAIEGGNVTVSSGTVTGGSYGVGIKAGTGSTVTISGTGKVIGGVWGDAINTYGNVEVKDNAEVSGSGVGVIGAIGPNSRVIVSGGVVKYTGSNANETIRFNSSNRGLTVVVCGTGVVQTAGNGPAISTYGDVEVKDGAEVSAASGETIYAKGASSTVTVSGGKVLATNDYAIRVSGENSKIYVSGGLVFAYAPAIAVNNDNNFAGVSGTGVVIAWDQAADNISYIRGSATDLSILPAGCAEWDNGSDNDGIAYSNGTNMGFIPIEGITVVASSGIAIPQTSLLQLYPNPDGNQISIAGLQGNEQLHLYSFTGRRLQTATATGETTAIDIAHLPAGIYLVGIQSDKGISTHKFLRK